MGNRAERRARTARTRLDEAAEVLRRQRRRLERSPPARRVGLRTVAWWIVAALVAWTVVQQVSHARAESAAWGDTVTVVVATQDLAAGDIVDEAAVSLRQVPAQFVPGAALESVPHGRRLGAEVATGEILLSSRIAPQGVGRTGAELPVGTQAVTVATGDAGAPVRPGDVVDVLAVGLGADPILATDHAGTWPSDHAVARVVARDATVLEVSDTSATLAVREAEVRPTIGAAAGQALSLVITG